MTNAELKKKLTDTLALLTVPGIGKGRFNRLVEKFGSAEAVLSASRQELVALKGISEQGATSILNNIDRETASKQAAEVISLGWDVVFPDGDDYPHLLRQIADSPPVLFRFGKQWTSNDQLVAMVGTRHATESGRKFARQLATEMAAAGLTVVSGMAEGIDTCAHQGALETGSTVAVWGRPLNEVFPEVNRGLAKEIEKNGSIYSEYLPGEPYQQSNFPERNRIISGMCEAVIVVEAGRKSGALITAEYALEQGRELFAVPGRPTDRHAYGVNELIKSGARILTCLNDLFDELPRLKGGVVAKRHVAAEKLTETEQKVVNLLADGPLQIDQLSREAELTVTEAMEFLLALELRGVVKELSGKRYGLSD